MVYTVITLNGKSYAFEADDVDEMNGRYFFYQDGEVVGIFLINGIAGYFAERAEDEEDD